MAREGPRVASHIDIRGFLSSWENPFPDPELGIFVLKGQKALVREGGAVLSQSANIPNLPLGGHLHWGWGVNGRDLLERGVQARGVGGLAPPPPSRNIPIPQGNRKFIAE